MKIETRRTALLIAALVMVAVAVISIYVFDGDSRIGILFPLCAGAVGWILFFFIFRIDKRGNKE
jgi:xanthine/uracil permease